MSILDVKVSVDITNTVVATINFKLKIKKNKKNIIIWNTNIYMQNVSNVNSSIQ